MSAPTVWIASGNAKKRVELERLFAGHLPYPVRSLGEAPTPIDWDEDAPDFAGNAAIKASTVARAVGSYALADDSGLVVDALGGAPGVHPPPPDATDADRIVKLLAELADAPAPRTARFVCHVCLAAPDGTILARFEETCEGSILTARRGDGGFGYDPVFVPDATRDQEPAPTFAELDPATKDAISHRGKALRRLLAWLSENPLLPGPVCPTDPTP
ncbi:MAG: non-canonical purine NTP pyrophosphatase [Planctomycetota bacterium]